MYRLANVAVGVLGIVLVCLLCEVAIVMIILFVCLCVWGVKIECLSILNAVLGWSDSGRQLVDCASTCFGLD